jgi:hypothetical protein
MPFMPARYEYNSSIVSIVFVLDTISQPCIQVLLISHKILHHEDSPRYLKELLSLRVPSLGLRSSDDPWLLAIPRSKGTYGHRSLCVMAPKLWNSLPYWCAGSNTPTFSRSSWRQNFLEDISARYIQISFFIITVFINYYFNSCQSF